MTEVHLKRLGQRVFQVLIALAVIVVALEFILHRHGKISLEDLPLFPALFGLVMAFVVVGAGYALKALLSRGEDYYDE